MKILTKFALYIQKKKCFPGAQVNHRLIRLNHEVFCKHINKIAGKEVVGVQEDWFIIYFLGYH